MNERRSAYRSGDVPTLRASQVQPAPAAAVVHRMPSAVSPMAFRDRTHSKLSLRSLRQLGRKFYQAAKILPLICTCSGAATTPLDARITNLSVAESSAATDVQAAYARLKAKATILQQELNYGTLLVGHYVTVAKGGTVTLPFLFVPSTFTATGVQSDIALPAGFTVKSVTAGQAATNAGKSVSANLVNTSERVIVFGLNQTPIAQGDVFLVTLFIPTTALSGRYPIFMTNSFASDGAGLPLLMSVMSGIVEVQ